MHLDDDNPLFLILEAGHSRASAAELFEIHPRTVNRWIEAGRMPAAPRLYLEFLAGRNPDWIGFRFRGAHVITPIGKTYHAQQVLSIDWMIRQLAQPLRQWNTVPAVERKRKALPEDSPQESPRLSEEESVGSDGVAYGHRLAYSRD